jgi:hypothetical protein
MWFIVLYIRGYYMDLIRIVKEHFWLVIGAAVGVIVLIFVRDINTVETIAAFFRRKQVESEIDKLKEVMAKDRAAIDANDEKLLKMGEELKQSKLDIKTASDQDIKDFYSNFLKK